MKSIKDYCNESLNTYEAEQLSDVKIEGGKMHKLLGIDTKEKIEDTYTSGIKLAQDLYDKVKDKKEVTGMLAFAANINKETDIFDKALSAVDEIKD